MKKKKDIAALVSGLVGPVDRFEEQQEETTAATQEEQQDDRKKPLDKELIAGLQITPDMVAAINQLRLQGSGRPKKGRTKGDPNIKRSTFLVDQRVVAALKHLAILEGRLYKDVVNEALTDFVHRWEKKTGNTILKV